MPSNKRVPHARFACDFRPLKEEQCRVRITVGGDKLDYCDDAGSIAANLLETKIIINRVVSDAKKGARFMSKDIKYHFLATPIRDAEHMKVKHKHLPQDVRSTYNIEKLKLLIIAFT